MAEDKNVSVESTDIVEQQRIALEQISIDNKIQALSQPINSATGVQDIAVKNDVETLQNMMDKLDDGNPQPEVSEEQLKEIFLNKLRNLDPEKRNKIIKDIANLQQVNPKNRSFSSINENKKQELLQRLHERRNQLGMKRKSKKTLQGMQKDIMEKYAQMQSQMTASDNSSNDVQTSNEENTSDVSNEIKTEHNGRSRRKNGRRGRSELTKTELLQKAKQT